MEHIEEAGIHSGDSACSLPARSLSAETIDKLEAETAKLALALDVGGLMNVQYALKDGQIYVLEVNPRASRTVPFVAKVIGKPIAKIASRIMAGEPLASFGLTKTPLNHVGVKEAVFPFARFPGVDTVLGPEMRSTGEVMGVAQRFRARLRQEPARRRVERAEVGHRVRLAARSRQARHRRAAEDPGRRWASRSSPPAARRNSSPRTASPRRKVNKVSEGRPNAADVVRNGGVQLVFNTTEGATSLADSKPLRRAALLQKTPYYTTLSGRDRRGGGREGLRSGRS